MRVTNSVWGSHRSELINLLARKQGQKAGVLGSIVTEQRLDFVLEHINSVAPGSVLRVRDARTVYREQSQQQDIDVRNLSSGMKSFVLIKTLLENGQLEERGTLILDEPEVHLHPEWQLAFAETVVLLYKLFDLTVLLATHSPYFLRAIEVYSALHGVADKCSYYHAIAMQDGAVFNDATASVDTLYADMSMPFGQLDSLMPEG